jgi:hypothetical protein
VRLKLPNSRAYDRAGTGGHSLFSTEHCCICGAKVDASAEWLLLARADDGKCEYAISHPSECTPEEIQSSLWVAPIGPGCLRRNPELQFAVLAGRERGEKS